MSAPALPLACEADGDATNVTALVRKPAPRWAPSVNAHIFVTEESPISANRYEEPTGDYTAVRVGAGMTLMLTDEGLENLLRAIASTRPDVRVLAEVTKAAG